MRVIQYSPLELLLFEGDGALAGCDGDLPVRVAYELCHGTGAISVDRHVLIGLIFGKTVVVVVAIHGTQFPVPEIFCNYIM